MAKNLTTDRESPATGSGTAPGDGSRPGWEEERGPRRPGLRRRSARRRDCAATAGSDNDAVGDELGRARRGCGRGDTAAAAAAPGDADSAVPRTAASPACGSATWVDFSFRSSKTLADRRIPPSNTATRAASGRRRCSGTSSRSAAGLECLEGKPPTGSCGRRRLMGSTP